jgi:predicted restriction endonuclease
MAEVLMRHAGDEAKGVEQLSESQGENYEAVEHLEDQVEQTIKNSTDIDETERLALVQSRRGQGRFRKNLMEIETKCRVSGVTDRRLLRASHIKPWRSCENNHERLDGYNGLLLAPHIDHLFDKGYISFNDDGGLVLSTRVEREQLARMGVPIGGVSNVGTFTPGQRKYLSHHRENVFH